MAEHEAERGPGQPLHHKSDYAGGRQVIFGSTIHKLIFIAGLIALIILTFVIIRAKVYW